MKFTFQQLITGKLLVLREFRASRPCFGGEYPWTRSQILLCVPVWLSCISTDAVATTDYYVVLAKKETTEVTGRNISGRNYTAFVQ